MKNQEKHAMNEAQRAAKRAAVLGTNSPRSFPWLIAMICLVLAAGGALLYWRMSPPSRTSLNASSPSPSQAISVSAKSTTPEDSQTERRYPTVMFMSGQAQYFEHQHEHVTIRYFILKSSDGIIRAAFDACDVCWPAGKGYKQEGDEMMCVNCGRRFKSTMINEVSGGCNPAPLERTVEDGEVVIRVDDILQGKAYFDFEGKKTL